MFIRKNFNFYSSAGFLQDFLRLVRISCASKILARSLPQHHYLQVSNNFEISIGPEMSHVHLLTLFPPYRIWLSENEIREMLENWIIFYSGVKERKPPNLPEWMLHTWHTTVSAILVFRIHSNLLKWIFTAAQRLVLGYCRFSIQDTVLIWGGGGGDILLFWPC